MTNAKYTGLTGAAGVAAAADYFIAPYTPGVLGYLDRGDPRLVSGYLQPMFVANPLFEQSAQSVATRQFQDWLGLGSVPGMQCRVADSVSRPVETALPLPSDLAVQVDRDKLKKVFSSASDDALKELVADLVRDQTKFELDSRLRMAHFLAQVREEAGPALKGKTESLNYAATALKNGNFKYYKNHPDEADTDGYVKDKKTGKVTQAASQETIANKAYGGRMGNGDASSGDGWKYRGRGYIQVTFKDNYQAVSNQYKKLFPGDAVDFVATPELMASSPYAFRGAICFWVMNGIAKTADSGEEEKHVNAVTQIVNFYTDSYKERYENFKIAYAALAP